MTVPQSFQYQGNQRALTALILNLFAAWICVWLFVGCVAPSPQSVQESNPAPVIMVGAGTNAVRLSPNSTPFYDYDSTLANSITQRWYDLLSTKQFRSNRTGKVVVRFHLHSNGTVSNVAILDNNVSMLQGVVCENAIQHCAPFALWPPDMEKMVGIEYREITFTFYYYSK